MATNPNRALNRLMGRLSALRQTLRKDERDLLDVIILGAPAAEVEAHRMVEKAQPAASKRASKRVTERVTDRIQPEVEGHRIDIKRADTQSTKRITERVTGRIQPEVMAHGMTVQADKRITERVTERLDWDADKKHYRVTE